MSDDAPKIELLDRYVMTDLEQIRVLADPLRVRILEQLDEPRTTKQVAERLGEKPTKLYHHVDALEKVGLIRLAHTKPNRGTLEKYFVAIASRFEADPALFSAGDLDAPSHPMVDMLSQLFTKAADEVGDCLRGGIRAELDAAVFSYVEVRASGAEAKDIQAKLFDLLKELKMTDAEEPAQLMPDLPDLDPDRMGRYRLTIGFFPLKDD